MTEPIAHAIAAPDGEAAWHRLLERLPSVREQFDHSCVAAPFVFTPHLPFRSSVVCGSRWALLPSAVGIVDPLLSTGIPLTLLGVLRLLDALDTTAPGPERDRCLAAYAQMTLDELEATERLVGALYAVMDDPALFKRLSLLYFAAASYSEMARRLGKGDRAPGFLLHGQPQFSLKLLACTEAAAARPTGAARQRLLEWIDRAVEPFDVAGLSDRTRRDWYPVRADDALTAASKLGTTPAEVQAVLGRCGFLVDQGRRS